MEDTIQIGGQIWMTQNLNVAHFRNGDPIEEAKTAEDWKAAGENKKPAWCYYNNDPTNGEKYGKLYNWYAVNDSRGLAPNGWKLPEGKCFSQLLVFLNATEGRSHNILKSTLGWEDYEYYAQTDTYEVFFESTGEVLSGNGNNESGFNGLPGGGRSKNGDFYYRGNNAFYWTFDQLKEPTLSNYELDELKYGDQLGLISLENYGAIHPNKESAIIKQESDPRALIFGLHSYAEYDPSRNVGYYESIFSSGNKQSGYSVRCIKNDSISNNTLLSSASINGEILKFASDEIKKNKEIVITSVKQNGLMLEFADNDLKNDKEVVLIAVQNQGIALQYASDNLKNDRETVLIAVQSRGDALRYASDELKNDKLVVQNAVQNFGEALKYASDDLKNNIEVVMIAVKGRSYGAGVLQFSSERLRNDKDVVLNAVEKNGVCLQFASDNLKNDREIVLIAVQNDGQALEYASDNLKNDREIVLIAVQDKGEIIDYVSQILKNDYEIILCSVRSVLKMYDWEDHDHFRDEYFKKLYSYCLKSVLKAVLLEICQEFCYDRPLPLPFDLGDELSNDRSFILDAVKINGLTLHNASDILKSDPEVCLEAIKNEKNSFEFIDESLKSNKEFLYQISLL